MSPSAISAIGRISFKVVEEVNSIKSSLSQGNLLNWVKWSWFGTTWAYNDAMDLWTQENCGTNDYELYQIRLIDRGKQWWKDRIISALAI